MDLDITIKWGNTHTLSFWKIPHLAFNGNFRQSISYKAFKKNSFLKFSEKTAFEFVGESESQLKTIADYAFGDAKNNAQRIVNRLSKGLDTLNAYKVNEDKLIDLSFDESNDTDYIDGTKYLSVKVDRNLTLFINHSYQLTHFKTKRLFRDTDKVIQFEGLKFTTPIYVNGLDLGEKKEEDFDTEIFKDHFLLYEGVFELQNPIQFDKRFINYWSSYLILGNDLFHFKAIKFENPFRVVKEKTTHDYIELLRNEDLWLASKIDKLCERNGKVKDLIHSKKIKGKLNSKGHWETNVYDFLKYLNDSNHSSNRLLLEKFIQNHFNR